MSRKEKKVEKQKNKTFRKIIIVAIFLAFTCACLNYAVNFVKEEITDKTNFIINNSNITLDLKKDIFIENGVVYVAKEDIFNFFDPYIYYDEKYNQIITGSDTRMASIVIGENKMIDNGSETKIAAPIVKKEDTYYIPFSELDDIYNVKTTYIQENNTVVVDSLNRKFVVADSNKNNQVKYKRTAISKTIDTLNKGENVVVVNSESKDGWIKVRTEKGIIGYVKEDTIVNQTAIRDDLENKKKIEGKISLVWDYIYEYSDAPNRAGKIEGVNVVAPTLFTLIDKEGEIFENVGSSGKKYINWAHSNGYEVWPTLANNSDVNNSGINNTSKMLNDSKIRAQIINKIVSIIVKYNLDGINIDFEYMYADDKDMFSRFIIELAPRLNEIGAVLSVDVTAPDGDENWSMCYDRHTIGKVADYIVFMAYDQYGSSSNEAGTTAGCDWVEANLDKFVGTQEEIDSDKIILGIPFYTMVWKETSKGVSCTSVGMKDLDDIIPSSAQKVWNENLKQYVAEYTINGIKYKIWIEDEKSIKEKLDLIEEYKLAGAAYWEKDNEPDSIWNLISSTLGIK